MFNYPVLKVGDKIIINEKNPDYGKMCIVVEVSTTNYQLPLRVSLVNPHDYFKTGEAILDKAYEKWISRENVELWVNQEDIN